MIFTLALAAVKIIQFADGVNEGIKLVGESTDLDQPSLVKVPAVFCIGNISNVKKNNSRAVFATIMQDWNMMVVGNL